MTLATSLPGPTGDIARLGSFFVQEYLRIMRGRLAKLIAAVMLCMVLAIPFIMERPPKELVKFLADWLGAEDFQRKLVLFVWVDASMNKLAVILGTVLAGGIIVDEKSRGTLDLLTAFLRDHAAVLWHRSWRNMGGFPYRDRASLTLGARCRRHGHRVDSTDDERVPISPPRENPCLRLQRSRRCTPRDFKTHGWRGLVRSRFHSQSRDRF